MFSVADLLERAMRGGNIDTHYRLAKVIGISQGAMTGYKSGKSMPDARVLEQLCALSGDDLAVVAAQIQAERERTPEAKKVWLMVAERLRGAVTPAILAALFAIGLIAAPADNARAAGLDAQKIESSSFIHRIYYFFDSGPLPARQASTIHRLIPALLRRQFVRIRPLLHIRIPRTISGGLHAENLCAPAHWCRFARAS